MTPGRSRNRSRARPSIVELAAKVAYTAIDVKFLYLVNFKVPRTFDMYSDSSWTLKHDNLYYYLYARSLSKKKINK